MTSSSVTTIRTRVVDHPHLLTLTVSVRMAQASTRRLDETLQKNVPGLSILSFRKLMILLRLIDQHRTSPVAKQAGGPLTPRERSCPRRLPLHSTLRFGRRFSILRKQRCGSMLQWKMHSLPLRRPLMDHVQRACSKLLHAMRTTILNSKQVSLTSSTVCNTRVYSCLIDIWPNHKPDMARLVSQVHK